MTLPRFDDLPAGPEGGRLGWGVFGDTDNAGLLNLQTPERVLAATKLVRTGKVFPLTTPLDLIDPPLFGRGKPEHHVLTRGGRANDDYLDNFYPQAAAQWDSLAHVAYSVDNFYNGVTERQVLEDHRDTIEHWAARGVACRGVILDMTSDAVLDGRDYTPGESYGFTVDEVERARAAAGVEIRPGDALFLHTGYLTWYREQPQALKDRICERTELTAVGIERSEEMARYLWDLHIWAIVSDNPAVEQWPFGQADEDGFYWSMHPTLIGSFGMALGELWWLADLMRDCAADGVHEFLLVSAPLPIPGGIGSPANAVALK
jgi:hypothetical protein